MPILFTDNAYFVAVWYFYADATAPLEDQFDWLAALWRNLPPGSPWHLQSRMRRYNDTRYHDSADQKTWYDATLPGTASEAEALVKSTFMAETLQRATGTRLMEIPLQCDGATALERMLEMQLDWLHVVKEDR